MLKHELGQFWIALSTKPKVAAAAWVQAGDCTDHCRHASWIADSPQNKTEGTQCRLSLGSIEFHDQWRNRGFADCDQLTDSCCPGLHVFVD